MDCALTLVAGGRPVKLVSECLGVARSQLTVRIKQSVSPKTRRSRAVDDAELVVEIQQQVSELPSYGYRRVWGLLRRERETHSLPAINVKRVYRVMRDHNLLLERRLKQPGVPRRHEGRIAVQTSDTRWCSDGFEFRCDDGAKLSVTFALDCCDREAIGWVASPAGYSGDDIRDLMLESVEKRFGDQLPVTPVQWLSDNGSAYTAEQSSFADESSSASRRFSIPAGDLSQALNSLAEQAGLVLAFDASLTRGKHSNGLSGQYDTDVALTQLLAGSGLQALKIYSNTAAPRSSSEKHHSALPIQSPPSVVAYEAPVKPVSVPLPEIAPMRRGRPTKVAASQQTTAHSASTSKTRPAGRSPQVRPTTADPFAALDAKAPASQVEFWR